MKYVFEFSIFSDSGWKAKLNIPERDHRVRTSVSVFINFVFKPKL